MMVVSASIIGSNASFGIASRTNLLDSLYSKKRGLAAAIQKAYAKMVTLDSYYTVRWMREGQS